MMRFRRFPEVCIRPVIPPRRTLAGSTDQDGAVLSDVQSEGCIAHEPAGWCELRTGGERPAPDYLYWAERRAKLNRQRRVRWDVRLWDEAFPGWLCGLRRRPGKVAVAP